jgi:hypothetical protein
MLIEVTDAGTVQVQLPTVVNLRTVVVPLVLLVGEHGAASAGSTKTIDEKAKRALASAIDTLFCILDFTQLVRNFNGNHFITV